MFRTALISMFITSTALADTWTVDDDGKADFDNIQAAVDAASDGDEIIVAPGTYTSTAYEVIDMRGKEIWLHSSKGAGVTIIDGQQTRRGIVCVSGEGPNTLIEGFTITNGDCPAIVGVSGGGMFNNNSSPTLSNCTFTHNTADYGGGISNLINSSPTLTNCTFESNTATQGGGMYNNSSSPALTNCTFESNTANQGGGMFNNSSSPTLDGCTFDNNSAEEFGGGGMFNDDSSPTLTNCAFTDNTTNGTGGGMGNFYSNPTLTNCTFIGNNAQITAGGISNLINSSPTLTDSTVCGNTPDQIFGNWTDNGGNTVADVCPPDCPADINGDGDVNVTDLLAVIDQWGLTDSPADVTGDGVVNVSDLLLVISNWGPCN